MRYAIPILFILALLATGCSQNAFAREIKASIANTTAYSFQQGYYRDSNYRSSPGYSSSEYGQTAIGGGLGFVTGHRTRAVDELTGTEFYNGPLLEANGMFIFPEFGMGGYWTWRHAAEVRLQYWFLDLARGSRDYGRLSCESATFAYKLLWVPSDYRVFGFHADAGLLLGSTYFDKNQRDLNDDLHFNTDIDTWFAYGVVFGIGGDFYLAPQVCFSGDIRSAFVIVPADWTDNGVDIGVDYFDASHIQVIGSIRFIF